MNILLVDDDEFVLSMLVRMLNKLNYNNILTASSGKEALVHLAKTPVDLIINDLNMPDMDGIELMGQIADFERVPHIILLSGVNRDFLMASERLAEAYGINVLGAVNKPLKIDNLKSLMKKFELKK